jgi:hypothetical protein
MSVPLSLAMYALLLVFFVLAWVKSSSARAVATPLLLFGTFEIVSVWPAMIYAQVAAGPVHGAYPALVAGLAFTALLLGFVVAMAAGRHSPEQTAVFRDAPVRLAHPAWTYLLAIVATACVLAGLGFYLYRGLPPLVEALLVLRQGANGLDQAISIVAAGREELTKGHYLGGAYRGQGLILGLMQIGWPYLAALALLLFCVTRRSFWLVVAVPLLVAMLFFIAGSGQRWQVLEALLTVAVTLSLAVRVTARWGAAVLITMLAVYLGMSVLNSNYQGIGKLDDPVEAFATLAASRIALSNGTNNVEAINFVEDGSLEPGLGTIHLQKFVDSIPGVGKSDVPFSARLAVLRDPGRAQSDSTWASQTYLGWLYVDLGLPGVVAVYLLIGALLALAQQWLFTRPKGLLGLPAAGFVLYFLGELSLDGPATVIAFLVVVGAFYVALRACAGLVRAPRLRPVMQSRRHGVARGGPLTIGSGG